MFCFWLAMVANVIKQIFSSLDRLRLLFYFTIVMATRASLAISTSERTLITPVVYSTAQRGNCAFYDFL